MSRISWKPTSRPCDWAGLVNANIIKTGERAYSIIAEWTDLDALAVARPKMIATLDTFRDTLEDLGGGLGVTDPTRGRWCSHWSRGGMAAGAAALHVQGRRVARAWEAGSRDALRGICGTMLSAPWTALSPAPGHGHTHEAHSHAAVNGETQACWQRSTVQGRNLISEATVNVLEPGGRRGVTGVEEERLHLCHEHISVAEGVAHFR